MFVLKLPHPHFLVKNEEFISNSCSPLLVVRNIWLASMVCKWKSMESLEDWAYLYYSIWNPVSHNQYAGAWIWTINSAECRWKLKILPFQRMIYRKKFNWKMFVMMLMLFHFVDSVEFKKHIFIFHNVGWCSWNEEMAQASFLSPHSNRGFVDNVVLCCNTSYYMNPDLWPLTSAQLYSEDVVWIKAAQKCLYNLLNLISYFFYLSDVGSSNPISNFPLVSGNYHFYVDCTVLFLPKSQNCIKYGVEIQMHINWKLVYMTIGCYRNNKFPWQLPMVTNLYDNCIWSGSAVFCLC